jgi:peptide/nickel transport system permease protein
MLKNILPRLVGSLVLLFVVPTITFFLQGLAPATTVAKTVLGVSATRAQINAFNVRLGLDQPLVSRYLVWLGGAVHGDLGASYTNNQAVSSILAPRLGVSLSLIVGSLLVFTIVGVILGIASATGGKVVGQVVDAISTIGIAVPNFWLAVIMVTLFAVELLLLPATGYVTFASNPGMWLASLVLPVVALSFAGITAVAKQTRDQMLIATNSPFTRTLRANGASEFSLVYKHALRNAAAPVVTVLGTIFVGALSGTVIIENIFVLPGLGSEALEASLQADLPVIQGIAVYFTVIVVIVNVLIDLVNTLLNPKVRTA